MNAVDLRALLADPAQAGAYFVDARDTGAMAEAGAALDFEVARIDLAGCADKADALSRFAVALRFPEWFGGNWDALEDCLGDLSWRDSARTVLAMKNFQRNDELGILIDILASTAQFWAEQGGSFVAIFVDPKRELDLPDLP